MLGQTLPSVNSLLTRSLAFLARLALYAYEMAVISSDHPNRAGVADGALLPSHLAVGFSANVWWFHCSRWLFRSVSPRFLWLAFCGDDRGMAAHRWAASGGLALRLSWPGVSPIRRFGWRWHSPPRWWVLRLLCVGRTPWSAADALVGLQPTSGSWGTHADQGVRPTVGGGWPRRLWWGCWSLLV